MKLLSKLSAAAIIAATWAPAALALDGIDQGAKDAKGDNSSLASNLSGSKGVFATIADILIYLVGAIAVIMLIIGGLRYVISQGDSTQVKQAKDTILYAIIGIVVAVLAYAIVHFIATNLK